MKKALIYDPYLDTLGGGERYTLTFAASTRAAGYETTFAWPDRRVLEDAKNRFNLDSDFPCDAAAFDVFTRGSLLSKWSLTKRYDLVFFVSDGSFPFLFSKRNLVHFQVPFTKVGSNFFINQTKGLLIHKLVFNSNFTAKEIKKQLPLCPSVVLYPPIDTDNFTTGRKENLILSVARFDSPSHAKRQDFLIEAMQKLCERDTTFRLILAGGLRGGEEYLSELKLSARKLPIEFIPNPDFTELKKLYAKAKIFWHAAGYGIDETKEPEKVEHFGITTVEAMSAGAVPVVINKGGQREIVTDNTGYLCDSVTEITSSTLSLIRSPEKLKLMSENAIRRSRDFSTKRFTNEVNAIV